MKRRTAKTFWHKPRNKFGKTQMKKAFAAAKPRTLCLNKHFVVFVQVRNDRQFRSHWSHFSSVKHWEADVDPWWGWRVEVLVQPLCSVQLNPIRRPCGKIYVVWKVLNRLWFLSTLFTEINVFYFKHNSLKDTLLFSQL